MYHFNLLLFVLVILQEIHKMSTKVKNGNCVYVFVCACACMCDSLICTHACMCVTVIFEYNCGVCCHASHFVLLLEGHNV
jgi:hypothetical protein